MKKAWLALALALLLVVLSERHMLDALGSAAKETLGSLSDGEKQEEQQAVAFTQQPVSHARTDTLDVTLYYRFGETNVLGAERVTLDLRREETIAMRIVELLVQGPDISRERLSGVFPQGTQVISVTGEDRTAFVTLSREFLGRPDGAPADWEDLAAWQEEAALRRRLAVQSIVLSLTEDGRFQRVQLYVADNDDEIPQRISMAWLDPSVTDPSLVLAASPRDEKAMLTPNKAMTMILEAWKKRDFASLYPLMASSDGEELPTQSAFEAEMKEIGVSLLTYSVTPGTVSYDGQIATLVLDAQLRSQEGGDAQIERESVPLVRWKDNWAIISSVMGNFREGGSLLISR